MLQSENISLQKGNIMKSLYFSMIRSISILLILNTLVIFFSFHNAFSMISSEIYFPHRSTSVGIFE